MPGQPMHYVVPAKAGHKELAEKFIALATSPEVQAEGIVKRFNWYPGIDANFVKPKLDDATWNKLFVDITPEDLANKGKPFPIAPIQHRDPGSLRTVGQVNQMSSERAHAPRHLLPAGAKGR
jgi:ABC-type glycerol-3-phosphate transport system substrate-binding protein